VREEHRLRTSDKRMLRNIFGLRRDELIGYWKRLNNEKLHDLCSHQILFGLSKPEVIWDRHVARMGMREVHTGFLEENLRDRDHLEEPSVDGIILIVSCRNGMGWHGVDSCGLG
jgi:hypothetical protein